MGGKHAVIPWSVPAEDPTWIWSGEVYVAETGDGGEENAAFIVRACNAHYQMLDALKAVAEWLEQDDVSRSPLRPASARLAQAWASGRFGEAVRAAIAAAASEGR